jgi:hypothetical protein
MFDAECDIAALVYDADQPPKGRECLKPKSAEF